MEGIESSLVIIPNDNEIHQFIRFLTLMEGDEYNYCILKYNPGNRGSQTAVETIKRLLKHTNIDPIDIIDIDYTRIKIILFN